MRSFNSTTKLCLSGLFPSLAGLFPSARPLAWGLLTSYERFLSSLFLPVAALLTLAGCARDGALGRAGATLVHFSHTSP